ncbi:MAG TPA: hypothetical protein VFR02_01085 [bacterium]|nr:hypothetical protein [bacterium]
MQELVTGSQAQQIVLLLCLLLTLGSAAFGFFWGRRLPKPQRPLLWAQAGLAALGGPLVAALWFVYNAIEDHYGLDSVKALGLNAALFLAVGVLFSYLFFWVIPGRFRKTRKA